MTRRVVVTGIGVVTPLGLTLEEYWSNLTNGASGIDIIKGFDVSKHPVKIAGEVKGFDPLKFLDNKEVKALNRFAQFALVAAVSAYKDSKLNFETEDRETIGAIVGSGIGGLSDMEECHNTLNTKGADRLIPFFIPRLMSNSASGNIAIKFGIKGPNFAVSSACASANHAMGIAKRLIETGESDICFAGGAEAAVTPLGMAGFISLRALSRRNDQPQKASRPFDKNRDGFVMGEGSAIFVFEELEHAKARGARIYAEVKGFGQSDDAYHVTAPDEDGSGGALAMRRALKDAVLDPHDIQYINAHGTSTLLNDRTETRAIKTVFGDYAKRIPISSTKSMIGHLLGAAGAAELVAAIMTLNTGTIHPTKNLETPDPDCDLDYVPNTARKAVVNAAMSNALGFGGHNTAIIVTRYEGR